MSTESGVNWVVLIYPLCSGGSLLEGGEKRQERNRGVRAAKGLRGAKAVSQTSPASGKPQGVSHQSSSCEAGRHFALDWISFRCHQSTPELIKVNLQVWGQSNLYMVPGYTKWRWRVCANLHQTLFSNYLTQCFMLHGLKFVFAFLNWQK
jgi:hypothetical protein